MSSFSLTSPIDNDSDLNIPAIGSTQNIFLDLCKEESSSILPSVPWVISEANKQRAYKDFLQSLSQNWDTIEYHLWKKLLDIFNEITSGEVHNLSSESFSTVNSLLDAQNLYEFLKEKSLIFTSLSSDKTENIDVIDDQVNLDSRGLFYYYISLDLVWLVVKYLKGNNVNSSSTSIFKKTNNILAA